MSKILSLEEAKKMNDFFHYCYIGKNWYSYTNDKGYVSFIVDDKDVLAGKGANYVHPISKNITTYSIKNTSERGVLINGVEKYRVPYYHTWSIPLFKEADSLLIDLLVVKQNSRYYVYAMNGKEIGEGKEIVDFDLLFRYKTSDGKTHIVIK